MNIPKQMTRDFQRWGIRHGFYPSEHEGKYFDIWTIAHILFGVLIALIVKEPVLGIAIAIILSIIHELIESKYWWRLNEYAGNGVMDIAVAGVGASIIYLIK